MIELLIYGSVIAAGYVLAIYTWPALRTVLVGVEQELAWIKARALDLEARVRAALSHDDR